MMLKPVCHLLKALVFSFILKYQPSSCVFETDAALTLALWIPPFEYQPKEKQQQTPTWVLRNAVSMTHRCFRVEKVAISPRCSRTLSRAGSFQSYTALAPSLFRSGTKRWVIDCNIDMFDHPLCSRFEMATSKGSQTRIFRALFLKLLAPTFPPHISLVRQVEIKLLCVFSL